MKFRQSLCQNWVPKSLLCVAFTMPLVGCQQANKAKPEPVATATTAAVSTMKPLALTPGSIQPGVGIKEVKIGESKQDVEKAIGVPEGEDSNEFVKGQTYLLYNDKGIELILQDNKVQAITLHSENKDWKPYGGGTLDGLGVSSTAAEVSQKMGTAETDAARALRYPSKGIQFLFDVDRQDDGANSRVESIIVHAPDNKEQKK